MGCFSREKGAVDEHAKWDYINLEDFHATSSWTPISYLWVWIFALIGVGAFVLDCFVAVNLLILDKWASEIKPKLDLKYSKWIFVGCIMFSFALYAFEWFRAIRIMRRGGVAESYMDPLTAQLQCMRPKGWKRFLVFAALTKSRKGTDYVAFFVHFEFSGFLRIVFAEGGRQGVNAMTIWSVAQSKFAAVGDHAAGAGQSPIVQFFKNVGNLYTSDIRQALILSSMVFTFVIWAFFALCLIAALILYLVFLWHQIPQSDGRLSIYCRRKIDRRLEKIVQHKVQAAFAEEERKLQRAETFGTAKSGKKSPTVSVQPVRQPTLPDLGGHDMDDTKSLGLSRLDTASPAPPPYDTRPGTSQSGYSPSGLSRQPTLPDMGLAANMPPRLARQGTGMSHQTYNSNASLIHNAGEMGYDSEVDSPHYDQRSQSPFGYRGPPARSMTGSTVGSQRGFGTPVGPHGPPRGMPVRSNTGFSTNDDRSPLSRSGSAMNGPIGPAYPPPLRTHTPDTYDTPDAPFRGPTPFSTYTNSTYSQGSNARQLVSRQSFSRPFTSQGDQSPSADRSSPPPMPSVPSTTSTPVNGTSPTKSGYVAFSPMSSFRSPSVPATMQPRPLQLRSPTNPVELQTMPRGQNYPEPQHLQRSYTAPIEPRRQSPPHRQYEGDRF